MSELARVCSISKPTCLAILTELTHRGYLRFDAQSKTYGLGPALVAAGHAAERDFALDPVVGSRLQELSKRFDTMCVASGRVGEQFMVFEVTTPLDVRPLTHVGQTFPFALPTALMYVLWQPDDVLQQWVAEHHSWSAGVGLAELQRMAAECRSTGYLVENLSPTLERVYRILGDGSHELSPDVRDLISDLLAGMSEHRVLYRDDLDPTTTATHRVGVISAPTFDDRAEQSLLLALNVLTDLSAAEIAERGAALRAVADEITAATDGRLP